MTILAVITDSFSADTDPRSHAPAWGRSARRSAAILGK